MNCNNKTKKDLIQKQSNYIAHVNHGLIKSSLFLEL